MQSSPDICWGKTVAENWDSKKSCDVISNLFSRQETAGSTYRQFFVKSNFPSYCVPQRFFMNNSSSFFARGHFMNKFGPTIRPKPDLLFSLCYKRDWNIFWKCYIVYMWAFGCIIRSFAETYKKTDLNCVYLQRNW